MSILVVGVTHRSGPLSLLERLMVNNETLPKAVADLAGRDNIREVAIVSTCNRTELYAVTERFHGAYAELRDFLCQRAQISAEDLLPAMIAQHDQAAVEHLFEVVAGLDSAVVGESEILGQVRDSWEVAQSEGGARTVLNLLFRTALEVGKRARTETAIGRGTASVSHAAVEMAVERLGDLSDRRVLVVGAGAMGEGIAVALHGAGAGEITVANRSADRGESLAARVGGESVGFERLTEAIGSADLILTCATTDEPLIDAALVSLARAPSRELLIIDVAVPRNVAGDVADLDSVTLFDLDHLRDHADHGRQHRLGEIDAVRRIIDDEINRFDAQSTALQAAPLVTALRDRAESVRLAELARYRSRLASLDAEEFEVVESLTRGIIAKLLHQPSVRLKDQAGTPQGERNAAAISDLFDLG